MDSWNYYITNSSSSSFIVAVSQTTSTANVKHYHNYLISHHRPTVEAPQTTSGQTVILATVHTLAT